MKKLVLLLAIMLIIPSTVFGAQVNVVKLPDGVDKVCSESVEGRIKYMNAEGKYGFLDDDYNIVVPAQYEVACDYSNGTAIVSYGPVLHNWGVIDLDGNEIIPAIYDYIKPFNSAGITVVKNSDGKDALANRNGELLTDWYDNNSCFTDDAAIMKNYGESKILINDKLEIIDLGKYDVDNYIYDGRIAAAKDGKLGYLDTDGNEVIPFIYSLDRYNGSFPIYDDHFSKGLARISFDGEHYGFINTDGEIVVPTVFDRIYGFVGPDGVNELTYAEKDGVSYLVNKSGEAVYSYIDRLDPCVWIDGEKWHIDYKSGGIYKYKIESEFYDGAALAFDEDRKVYGIVDENYNIIHDFDIPATYVYILAGQDSYNHLLKPELSEGLIKVCIDGKWGYMNTKGEMVIPPQFDKLYRPYGEEMVSCSASYIIVGAEKFRHGYAKVSLNGVRYTIDKNGELYENIDIVEPTGVNDFSCYLFLDNDYAALRDANENVILEVRDGTVTDANGSVLIENCATELFDTNENRSHPAIGFAADGGSTCGNILNVNTADGKYAVEIVGSE